MAQDTVKVEPDFIEFSLSDVRSETVGEMAGPSNHQQELQVQQQLLLRLQQLQDAWWQLLKELQEDRRDRQEERRQQHQELLRERKQLRQLLVQVLHTQRQSPPQLPYLPPPQQQQ